MASDSFVDNVTDAVSSIVEWHGSTVPSEELDNDQDHASLTVVVVLRTFFIILNVTFIMVANAFCIYVVKSSRYMSAASKTFTIALAISDFTTGLRLSVDTIPSSFLDYWPYGEAYCQIAGDFTIMMSGMSISFLILLGIDRLIAITKGLRYRQIMTQKRSLAAAIAVAILNVVLYFPLPYDIRAKSPLPYPEPHFKNDLATCFHVFTKVPIGPLVTYLCITVFVPVVSALCIYVTLVITAARQKAKLRAELSTTQQSSLAGSIWMFSFAMLGFVIAFSPVTSMILYEGVANQRLPEWIEFCVIWVAFSNSWWNVIIYANSNRLWRKDAAKAVRHLKRKLFDLE